VAYFSSVNKLRVPHFSLVLGEVGFGQRCSFSEQSLDLQNLARCSYICHRPTLAKEARKWGTLILSRGPAFENRES